MITQHHFKLLLTKDGTREEKTWISCGSDKAFGAAFDPTKKTPGGRSTCAAGALKSNQSWEEAFIDMQKPFPQSMSLSAIRKRLQTSDFQAFNAYAGQEPRIQV
jgi:hypothetical protein